MQAIDRTFADLDTVQFASNWSRPQAGAAASIATGPDVAQLLHPTTRHLERGAVATAIEDAR